MDVETCKRLCRPGAIAIVPLTGDEGGGWMAHRIDAPMTYVGDGDTPLEALEQMLACVEEIEEE